MSNSETFEMWAVQVRFNTDQDWMTAKHTVSMTKDEAIMAWDVVALPGQKFGETNANRFSRAVRVTVSAPTGEGE